MKMSWPALLCGERARATTRRKGDLRGEFEKDYHRLIISASFRRLQDKTQVFPLNRGDFVRTRLTHSLEVSSIAKSLSNDISAYILKNALDPDFTAETAQQVGDILSCAGLLHDIGNPPFGHFGEECIRDWFRKNLTPGAATIGTRRYDALPPLTDQMLGDLYNFEGNAQALRLVSKLHFMIDEHGMNLTYALLNTLIKYPGSSLMVSKKSGNIKDKKMGYFLAEEELYRDITGRTGAVHVRHPLTFILEAADDIAYCTADIEDGYKKDMFTFEELCAAFEPFRSGSEDQRRCMEYLDIYYKRACDEGYSAPELYAIQNWMVSLQGGMISGARYAFTRNYEAIMNGDYATALLDDEGAFLGAFCQRLKDFAYKKIFTSGTITRLEIASHRMLSFLMDLFVKAVLYYDTPLEERMDGIDRRILSVVSQNYKDTYKVHARGQSEEVKFYLRLLLVTDYLCGMTDGYAHDLYNELSAQD